MDSKQPDIATGVKERAMVEGGNSVFDLCYCRSLVEKLSRLDRKGEYGNKIENARSDLPEACCERLKLKKRKESDLVFLEDSGYKLTLTTRLRIQLIYRACTVITYVEQSQDSSPAQRAAYHLWHCRILLGLGVT